MSRARRAGARGGSPARGAPRTPPTSRRTRRSGRCAARRRPDAARRRRRRRCGRRAARRREAACDEDGAERDVAATPRFRGGRHLVRSVAIALPVALLALLLDEAATAAAAARHRLDAQHLLRLLA